MASAKSGKAKTETPKAKIAPKSEPGKGLVLGSAALQHGEAAFGARFKKPGFAFTADDDLAFALGYPHFFMLADGHPDDADPEKAAPLYVSKHDFEPPMWPREVAARMARGFGLQAKPDQLKKAYKTAGALTEAEARALVKRDLHRENGWIQVYLLEALLGPSVVVGAVLDEIERYSTTKRWEDSGLENRSNTPSMLLRLGYLLLRLPAAEEANARGRLEALYKAWSKRGDSLRETAAEALDVVLHGKEGADRSAYKPDDENVSTGQPLHVLDDPAWIVRAVRASGAPDASSTPDPRLVFLGGEEVLALEISWWKKYTKAGAHAQAVERFGKIKSPRLLPWMLEMSATSKAKTSAAAWFAAHADYARPFLEETANGKSAAAEWAKALLSKAG